LSEDADVDAPAFDGHVYAADAVAQALADAGVVPLQHDKVAGAQVFNLVEDFLHVLSSKENAVNREYKDSLNLSIHKFTN
jgi:hypothetical protein